MADIAKERSAEPAEIIGATTSTPIGNVEDALKIYNVGSEPWLWQVAGGFVDGYIGITKYGRIPQMGAVTRDIVNWGSNIHYPTTASTLSVLSSSNSDTGATVQIYGLDANWNMIEEFIVLQNNSVTTTNSFLRVNGARHVIPATGQTSNVGNVDISIGNNTMAYIIAGKGSTEQCAFAIPAGYKAYILNARTSIYASSGSGNKQGLSEFFIRMFGSSWMQVSSEGIDSNGGAAYFDPNMPLVLGEKTDVKLSVTSSQNSTAATGIIQYVLEAI